MIEDDGILGQPTCPDDGVLLRDIPGGARCPVCGYEERYEPAERVQINENNVVDFYQA